MCRFLCFQNIMTWLPHPTGKCLFKVKSRNTILIYWLWSKSTIKTAERCHVVFSFNLEHIQQINLIFLLLNLNMYLSVGHRIKITKQFKCTLSSRAVSLKHVHVAGLDQHSLNNPWTSEINVPLIIVTGLWVGGGWAGWTFFGGLGAGG